MNPFHSCDYPYKNTKIYIFKYVIVGLWLYLSIRLGGVSMTRTEISLK